MTALKTALTVALHPIVRWVVVQRGPVAIKLASPLLRHLPFRPVDLREQVAADPPAVDQYI